MGRSWQFFLTVAITAGVLAYFYYTSDYYAERSAARPAATAAAPEGPAAPAEGGIIPSNE